MSGCGKHVMELEPVKVVKNPDGSLAQAALMQVILTKDENTHISFQGALSKERRDIKIQQQREKDAERQRGGLGRSRIHDPMAANSATADEGDEQTSQQKKVFLFS